MWVSFGKTLFRDKPVCSVGHRPGGHTALQGSAAAGQWIASSATAFQKLERDLNLIPNFSAIALGKHIQRRHLLKMLLYRNGSFIVFPLTFECF